MKITMETAALTSIAAVAGGIVCAYDQSSRLLTCADALTYSEGNTAQALTGLLPPLYGLSLLYSLNAREAIRTELGEKSVVSGRGSLHPVPQLEIGLTSHGSQARTAMSPWSLGVKSPRFVEPSALYSSRNSESADGPLR